MEAIHIALVSHLSGHGGISVYNQTMAKALVDLGYKVSIITSHQDPEQLTFEEIDGIKVYRLTMVNLNVLKWLPFLRYYQRSFRFLFYSFQVAQFIKKLNLRDKLDIIEFAEAGGEGFGYLWQKHHLSVIVRCHTPTFVLRKYYLSEEMPYDTKLVSWMEKFCIRHADALTAPSSHMAKTIASECDLSENEIKAIPNPLDISVFEQKVSLGAEYLDMSDLKILHVGRLERIKGIEILLQAIPEILKIVPKAKFVFIGTSSSDAAANNWKQRLESVGKGNVVFLGFLEFREMLSWYKACDIAVVPSINYESFSYTCAQAMAIGLPVIASRIGGIPETVGENIGGLLFEPGNVDEFVKAAITLANDPQLRLRMGKAGRERAINEFDAPIIARIYADFLHEMN